MKKSVYTFALLALIFSYYFFCVLQSAYCQEYKPVLVVFHGTNETTADMDQFGKSALDTKMFFRVVVVRIDYGKYDVPTLSARIFKSLDATFPNMPFVLMGNGEGGLIAEWIATKLKVAESRVVRVITLNSPLDGTSSHDTTSGSPNLKGIEQNSTTILGLKSAPINDLSSTDFVRLWERDNKTIDQESALRMPVGTGSNVHRAIVRTKEYDPREALPEMIAQLRSDIKNKEYDKVIEKCQDILKIQPGQPEASLMIGLSFYNLAVNETDPQRANRMYSDSFSHLVRALTSGYEITLPIKHHHAIGIDQGLCSGYLTITKDILKFHSIDGQGHDFNVPLSKVYELRLEPMKVGRLHMKIGFERGKHEAKANYNFHSAEVKIERKTMWLNLNTPYSYNEISCTVACLPSMDILYKLIQQNVR